MLPAESLVKDGDCRPSNHVRRLGGLPGNASSFVACAVSCWASAEAHHGWPSERRLSLAAHSNGQLSKPKDECPGRDSILEWKIN